MTAGERVFLEVMDGMDITDAARRWHETPQRIREVVYEVARARGLYQGKLPTIVRLRQRWAAGTDLAAIPAGETP